MLAHLSSRLARNGIWGKQAKIAQQYLREGSFAYAEGHLQSRESQNKEVQKRTSFEIVDTNCRMLGARTEGAVAPGVGAGAGRNQTPEFTA